MWRGRVITVGGGRKLYDMNIMKGKCIHCGASVFLEEEVEPIGLACEDCEGLEPDHSPTGHGQDCYSDADTGL